MRAIAKQQPAFCHCEPPLPAGCCRVAFSSSQQWLAARKPAYVVIPARLNPSG